MKKLWNFLSMLDSVEKFFGIPRDLFTRVPIVNGHPKKKCLLDGMSQQLLNDSFSKNNFLRISIYGSENLNSFKFNPEFYCFCKF